MLVPQLKGILVEKEQVAKMPPEVLSNFQTTLKKVFENLWSPLGVIIAILDRRFPGLIIPDYLRTEEGPLILRYDANPPIPIPDLELTQAGISATLSFQRSPYKTFVPWEAIEEMCSIVDDSPPENQPKKRPKLTLVP